MGAAVSPAAPSAKEDALFLLLKLAILAGLLAAAFTFFLGMARCNGDAMAPAAKDGDLVLYWRLADAYLAGDMVVLDREGADQVRRVAAVPGDTVDITAEGLVVNGYVQGEPEIYGQTLPYKNGAALPVELGKGEYFVLADAREGAEDSRAYGPVSETDVKGNVMTLIRHRRL